MCLRFLYTISLLSLFFVNNIHAGEKTIIAEGNFSSGLIENTLPATTVAIAENINFIQLQVVMTADNKLIILQNLTLNGITDVARVFPDRNRKDGNYFAVDFTLQEIRQLRVSNPFDTTEYPLTAAIPTLAEELGLIRTLEQHFNKPISISVEIRHPWFHKDAGKDISAVTLNTLADFGYGTDRDTLLIQCFDPEELQRIHTSLLPEKQLNIPLIQLIGSNDGKETRQLTQGRWEAYNFDWLFTNIGLRMVATYASAIALPSSSIVDTQGNLLLAPYIQDIHKYGLRLFVYSLNNQSDEFPPFATDFSSLLNFYFITAKVDGAYTNSFNEILQYLKDTAYVKKQKNSLPSFFSSLDLSRPKAKEPIQNDTEE